MAGKYGKQRLLGSGSFGQAWLVTNKDKLKSVLKEIKLTSLSEKEVDQALVEVTVLAKCRNVNVIKYREAFVEEKCLKIVIEYADGGDLQKKIQDQKGIHLSKETVFDWFVQIVFALKYIHGKNILHRDLKSQNVFLTSQNIVKLGDFGIPRILKNSMDHAVTTIGTPSTKVLRFARNNRILLSVYKSLLLLVTCTYTVQFVHIQNFHNILLVHTHENLGLSESSAIHVSSRVINMPSLPLYG
ncbi:serine/threonine-protein kinase Nek1-like [Haliotis asinina]|uniref:serine/threonine-protein kinase Nek1-like n=1 Tax=Haliotis asinina TaxID=109174 RepID=UPI0035318884